MTGIGVDVHTEMVSHSVEENPWIDNTGAYPGTLESRQHILNTIFLLHFNLVVIRIAYTYL